MNCLRIFTSGLLFLFVSQILLANASPMRKMDVEEVAAIKEENEADDDVKSLRKFRKIKKSWNPSDIPSNDETWLDKFLEDEKASESDADVQEISAEPENDEDDDEQSKKPERTDDEDDDQDQDDEEVEERKLRKNVEGNIRRLPVEFKTSTTKKANGKFKKVTIPTLIPAKSQKDADNQDDDEDVKPLRRHNTILVKYPQNRKNRKQVLPQNEPCFNYPYCYKGLQGE